MRQEISLTELSLDLPTLQMAASDFYQMLGLIGLYFLTYFLIEL